MHLVRGLAAGAEQRRHLGFGRHPGHLLPLRVRGQLQEAPGLVVRQQQSPLTADDEHPFAYGVQYRVVVLIHAGHLVRGQAVSLPSQPPAHQHGGGGGHCECARPGGQDDRYLPVHQTGHVLDLEPGGNEGHHLAPRVLDGHGRLHFVAEGTLHAFGIDLPRQRRLDLSYESLADPVRQGMGVADPFRVHHHDEVDARGLASLFGQRLQDLRGLGCLQCGQHARGVREGLRDGYGSSFGLGVGVPLRLKDEGEDGECHEQHHQRHLQEEYLPRDASHVPSCQ